ncbi:MAG: hypothetical protein PVI26_11355 [Chitinispirillia bacterium]|jgi:pectate lyase
MNKFFLFILVFGWYALYSLDFSLVGFGGNTTGGHGGDTVEVSTGTEFKSKCGGSEKRVIILNGKVSGGDSIGSNKTVIGLRDKGEFSGGTVTVGKVRSKEGLKKIMNIHTSSKD